ALDGQTVNLPGHGMQTGQAVLYRAGSGVPLMGMTDNTVYYVIADPIQPNQLKLAATLQDALANNPLKNLRNPGNGTQHSLPRVAGFQTIANLAGDTEPDTFALLGNGRLTGLVNGGAGFNTVVGPSVDTTWTSFDQAIGQTDSVVRSDAPGG